MKQYTREELLELAPAYALGATSADENAAIEAALPSTPGLAAEVAAYRNVAANLAQRHAMKPSPAVRAAFLEKISAGKTAALPVPRAQTRAPAWLLVAFAASVIVAVRFGMQNRDLNRELTERETALAAATAEATKRHEQLNTILEGEKDLRIVQLKSADTVAGPGIQFFWNVKQHRALAHAFRLKPAPAGRTYQVWFLVRGKPVGVGVFNSDLDGHAIAQTFTLPESVDGVSDVLITEEPAGGSPQPTTTPFIGGKMPAL
jgi:anti-sigma-K factor RskA